jgi:hypothetical protein
MADEKDPKDSGKDDKSSTLIGEAVKKLFTVGVTAAFMTEESLRNYLSDIKLPKEVFGLILQGANRSKDEITQRVTREIAGVLSKIDYVKEFSKFAETHKFKVTAEIEIQKKEPQAKEKS